MARGGQAASQLQTTNQEGSYWDGQGQIANSKLMPAYSSLMSKGYSGPTNPYAPMDQAYGTEASTGYFSPQEKAATTEGVMGSAAQPFESGEFTMANRAGASNNPAGLTEGEDQLALEKGRTMGEAAAGLGEEEHAHRQAGLSGENQIAQEMQGNKEAGMYGLSGLNEADQRAMESMYGLGPSTLNAQANLQQSSYGLWPTIIQSAMQGAGQGAGLAAG